MNQLIYDFLVITWHSSIRDVEFTVLLYGTQLRSFHIFRVMYSQGYRLSALSGRSGRTTGIITTGFQTARNGKVYQCSDRVFEPFLDSRVLFNNGSR
jgi:hypothetical protein